MDGENRAFVYVIGIISMAVVLVVATIGGCTMHEGSAMESMVKAGANPMQARCAVKGPSDVCKIMASKQ